MDKTLSSHKSRRWSNTAWVAMLALGAFAVHFPGQASLDTLLQLQDGTTRIYTSNQPPVMSLLLAVLTMPGILALNIVLFSLAILQLPSSTPTCAQTPQRTALAAMFLFPVLLIYMGIVWKDVLFAHAALLALLLLPRGEQFNWKRLAASAAVLALAISVRQQGAIAVVVAVLYLVFSDGIRGVGRMQRWKTTGTWIAVFLLFFGAIKLTVQASGDTKKSVTVEGPLRQLAMFDLGGIASRVPELSFPAIEKSAPAIPLAHRPTREHILKVLDRYTPERQDYMDEPDLATKIWISSEDLFADWRTNILRHPKAYLMHRLDAMSWTLGCHDPAKCVPFVVGIPSEPAKMIADLGIVPGTSERAELLGRLGNLTLFMFRPVLYIALSLAVLGYLLYRGARDHGLMITVQISGLIYAASYLLVGFACDFRYTYYSTVTALLGLAYVMQQSVGAPCRAVPETESAGPGIPTGPNT